MESSQKVYERLMTNAEDGASALPFTVFSVLATDENGELVDDKMRSLIRLFRPDRQGTVSDWIMITPNFFALVSLLLCSTLLVFCFSSSRSLTS